MLNPAMPTMTFAILSNGHLLADNHTFFVQNVNRRKNRISRINGSGSLAGEQDRQD